MSDKRSQRLKRYSAALLFQFRSMVDGNPGKIRLCEKRIIHFKAPNAQAALKHAKRRAHESEYRSKNVAGGNVFFEFVGVRDLLCFDSGDEPDEVWYQVIKMVTPMERKRSIIPHESQLSAIRFKN